MATFNINENDTSPALEYALIPTTVNLTGASVVFRMRPIGSTTWALSGAATVITATGTPTVSYEWGSGDTATPGFYEAQFNVTYSDNTVETFPNSGYITVNVNGDESGLSENVNGVRFLIGDTDNSDYAISNDNILFALTQASDDVYGAAAICARALAAKYSSLVDTSFESVSSNYSQLSKNYMTLATQLEMQSRKYGRGSLGVPAAGGLRRSDFVSLYTDNGRNQPRFRQDMFSNPPGEYDGY